MGEERLKERIYKFDAEVETVNDFIWFVDYDVLIINGIVIDSDFWHGWNHTKIAELRKFVAQKITDYKFVEFTNGKVVALVQAE